MHTDESRFVNPYTFLGLPKAVARDAPTGHDVAVDSGARPTLSGIIVVDWELLTPLLLPRKAEEEGWVTRSGRVTIPGSSLKGALRSLHETLFNGCLRVVDDDFLPAYRVLPTTDTTQWKLGVVTESLDGTPTEITVCEKLVFVEATSLKAQYEENAKEPGETQPLLPTSGDVLAAISGAEATTALDAGGQKRREIRAVTGVKYVGAANYQTHELPGGRRRVRRDPSHRVLFVSDTNARTKTHIESCDWASCFWATGIIGERSLPVHEDVAQRFRRTCEGSDDQRRFRQPNADSTWRNQTTYGRVSWWPAAEGKCHNPDAASTDNQIRSRAVTPEFKRMSIPVANRAKASGLLHAGDVVWVLDDGAVITEISLALIWRRLGHIELAERLPGAQPNQPAPTLPCRYPYSEDPNDLHYPTGLCPSCRTFGSADTSGATSGEGDQHSYSGHVRIGPARSHKKVKIGESFSMAPMGTPHPGAGMFYLKDRKRDDNRPVGDLPSQWGSHSDPPDDPRQVRGRKYYWHSDPQLQAEHWTQDLKPEIRPRYERRTGQQDQGKRQLVPAGTTFRQRISVDGLDRRLVMMLLAAIEPARILAPNDGHANLAIHLGGGKPLGLGSARGTIVEAESVLHECGQRYRGGPRVDLSTLEFSDHFRADLDRDGMLCTERATLRRILDIHGLGPWQHHVTYPGSGSWRSANSSSFFESYRFFSKNSGRRDRDGSQPYAPLPVAKPLGEKFNPSSPNAWR